VRKCNKRKSQLRIKSAREFARDSSILVRVERPLSNDRCACVVYKLSHCKHKSEFASSLGRFLSKESFEVQDTAQERKKAKKSNKKRHVVLRGYGSYLLALHGSPEQGSSR
jgi:hypothetical protein